MFLHQLANLVDLIDRNRKIQIETDQRLHVGVNGLTTDHAEMHPIVLEQRENFLQESKRPATTVFLRQPKAVILEEWEVRGTRKF